MKFSRFVFVFHIGNYIALYHSLLLKKVYLTKKEWDILRPYYNSKKEISIVNNLTKRLFELGMIVEDGAEDEKVYKKAQSLAEEWQGLSTLFLIVTNDCNFACRHCYEGAWNQFKRVYMKKEIAEKALEQYAIESENSKKDRNIFFYGGEPLLNYPLIKYSYKKIEELRNSGLLQDVELNITTNGSLINDEVISDALKYDVFFGVSIDGFKHNHDASRIFKNGQGTFDLVVSKIRELQKNGVKHSLICTVGKHNVDELDKIAEFFATELNAEYVGFNLLLDQPGGGNKMAVPYEKATEQLIKAFEVLREYGVKEGRVTKQLISIVEESLYLYECDACGSQVVVDPEGNIGPCLGFLGQDKFFEKWDGGPFKIRERALFKLWPANTAITMPQCKTCPALGICGGGCHYNRYMKTGRLDRPDPDFCKYANKVLRWSLKVLSPENE